MRKDLSYKTAINRDAPSKPMQYLEDNQLLYGRSLDFGCGLGFDASWYAMDKYDLHHTDDRIIIECGKPFPMPLNKMEGKYDTITCNYVLNTIDNLPARDEALNKIESLLAVGGKAYISVRRDKDIREGYTNTGSWQGTVELEDLPTVVHKKGNFQMYLLEKAS